MKGFVKISRYAGMREDLVQAGGGNSSYKQSRDRMIIKASGYQLADMTEVSGYSIVNPLIIQERFLHAKTIERLTEQDGKKILQEAVMEGEKPSIETFLHAISGQYTLHTHPIVINALTCRRDWKKVLGELYPGALLIPYATPGIELAKAYFKSYQVMGTTEKPELVFLQNHGLVVSAESADELIQKTEKVIRQAEQYLKLDMSGYHKATELWSIFPEKIVWKVTDANILKIYSKYGHWRHAFCPDCVVFLGKAFLKLQDDYSQEEIDAFNDRYGEPVMIDYAGELFILAENVKKALEIQSVMSFSAQVMAINSHSECNLLSDQEQSFLLHWEEEKYRKRQ